MALVGGGAQAELAVVDEAHALGVPAGLSWPEAGGFMEAYATAYDALFGQAVLTLGDRVLVTGAAGGVGSAACPAGGARRRPRRRVRARPGTGTRRSPRSARPRSSTRTTVAAHGPYDVVLELVGAASLPSALECARHERARRGHRRRQRRDVEVDLMALMGRRARISASSLRARSSGEKAVLIATLGAQVVPAVAGGRLRVPVAATFALRDAAAAYERFAAGGKLGKIVLTGAS